MTILKLYLLVLFVSVVLQRGGVTHRPRAVLMLPLILLDCLFLVLLGGSFRNTLSGEAWRQRDHKYWWWCHHAINAIFFWDQDHCEVQSRREEQYGSVWAAWFATYEDNVSQRS